LEERQAQLDESAARYARLEEERAEDGRQRGARRRAAAAQGAPADGVPPPPEQGVRRGRGDSAAADDVPDAPAPKRRSGGARVGKSGRHGVYELTGIYIRKDTPWLTWRAELCQPGEAHLQLGLFPTADDAARAHDAEVRRRGWAHVKPLNFPQPEEQAA